MSKAKQSSAAEGDAAPLTEPERLAAEQAAAAQAEAERLAAEQAAAAQAEAERLAAEQAAAAQAEAERLAAEQAAAAQAEAERLAVEQAAATKLQQASQPEAIAPVLVLRRADIGGVSYACGVVVDLPAWLIESARADGAVEPDEAAVAHALSQGVQHLVHGAATPFTE